MPQAWFDSAQGDGHGERSRRCLRCLTMCYIFCIRDVNGHNSPSNLVLTIQKKRKSATMRCMTILGNGAKMGASKRSGNSVFYSSNQPSIFLNSMLTGHRLLPKKVANRWPIKDEKTHNKPYPPCDRRRWLYHWFYEVGRWESS